MLASIGAALFILLLGALDALTRGAVNLPALIPPFGASTLIVFYAPDSPASRPWNVVVGHLGAALLATAAVWLLPAASLALVGAVAVAAAGVWMALTRSVHPPGGATALLLVLAERQPMLEYLVPVAVGCVALVAVRWLLDAALELTLAREVVAGEPELGDR